MWSTVAQLWLAAAALGLLQPQLSLAQPDIAAASAKDPVLNGFEFPVDLELAWEQGAYPSRGDDTLYCRALVNGEVVSPVGEVSVFNDSDSNTGLAMSGSCEDAKVNSNGMATVTVQLSYDKSFPAKARSESSVRVRSIPGGLTVLPPIVAVVLAVATRNVLVALFCGIWVAAFFIHAYDPFRGFLRAIDTYVVGALADTDHVKIILFSWFLSGITGLVQRSGGAQGLANSILKRAKTRRSTMIVCFCCGLAIFFDDYANSLIVGNTFRPIMDSLLVSREKLAYITDATSAPVASISPISSWIGFELSLIDESYTTIGTDKLAQQGWETSPFLVFLKTIPGRFYPIAMLFLQGLLIVFQRDFGPMFLAERRSHRTGKVYADDADVEQVKINAELENKAGAPPRWWNAVIPIGLVIIFVFLALILTGVDAVQADPSVPMNIQNVFGNGDSYNSLLWTTFFVSLLSWGLYRMQYFEGDKHMWFFNKSKKAQPILRFKQSEDTWIEGIKQLLATTLVLILAWGIGKSMTDMGTDTYIASGVSSAIDKRALPALTFILSVLISVATGTSWGTMSILFPVATKAAYASDPGSEDLMLQVIASILSGSVFGDHVTPISDTTILSSLASRCDLMHHVKTQAPYALLVGLCALFFGNLLSGYAYPMYVGLILTVISVVALGFVLSAKPDSETDKVDLVNKAFGKLFICCGRRSKGEDMELGGAHVGGHAGSGSGSSDSIGAVKRSSQARTGEAGEGVESALPDDGLREDTARNDEGGGAVARAGDVADPAHAAEPVPLVHREGTL